MVGTQRTENNRRDITQQVSKGEQPFLNYTYFINLIHITLNLHQDSRAV